MSAESELFARLRRLRRERPAAVRSPAGAPTTNAPPEGLVVSTGERGRLAVRAKSYAGEHRHGRWRLDEIGAASLDDIALVTGDPALHTLDLRHAVYLDIETTGLSGGAGTVPFLVALGRFAGDEFVLWQGFLPGPEDEQALLGEVARRVRDSAGVVSFFGKSFDRHRLEDKMRVHGIEAPFEGRPHLDLFHPLARLYREALPDGRLATVEAELCGVVRRDDLAGSFAPEAWFDFLADRPHRLEAVFRHNADDVLSLVVLAAHLGRTLSETRAASGELGGPAWARARALARLFAARREHARALRWIERALERRSEDGRALRVLRADLRRLAREDGAALEEYELLAAEERDEYALHCLPSRPP